MLRIVTGLAVAVILALAGRAFFLTGEPVPILVDTAHPYAYPTDDLSGWLPIGEPSVLLVASAQYGTALGDTGSRPAIWPPGFVGRRLGSEVSVYDAHGNFVASTGRRYYIDWVSNGGIPFGEVICRANPA